MNKKISITFFIEGQEHLRFVLSYILICKDLGFEIVVISLESLDLDISDVEINIINQSNLRASFKNICTEWLFTTTPGVGSFYFPKSKKGIINKRTKYVYLFHSLVSPNEIYLDKSFEKFDVILSPNRLITEQLKYVTSKNVKTFTVGYPVLSQYQKNTKFTNKKTVLIAPSWGEESFLLDHKFMEKLVKSMLMIYDKIIIRPHPMHLAKLQKQKKFKNPKITYDFDKNLDYLNDVQMLVTDWSGISLEYYFLTNNKLIFIDGPKKIRRKLSKHEKGIELIEDKIRNIIGTTINKTQDLGSLLNKNISISHKEKIFIESLFNPKFVNNDVKKIIKTFTSFEK